jgi:MYXO-CTERM domain-containing protein
VYSSGWQSSAFVGIAPDKVIDQLQMQGLVYCYDYGGASYICQYNHPLIVPLLNEYLPVPSGVNQDDFYGCLSCNTAKIDSTKWNAQEFAADFKLRIEDPGKHAADLLMKWPYLTRMFTTISPEEMKLDPDFHAHPGLAAVNNRNQIATRRTTCAGKIGMILPDTRQVALDNGVWPAWDSEMAWAERIEEFPEGGGDAIVLVDNTDAINAKLDEWNAAHGWPPSPWSSGAGGSGNGVGYAGSGNYSGAGANKGKPSGDSGGGGCALGGNDGSTGLVLLIGTIGALARRRRRRS